MYEPKQQAENLSEIISRRSRTSKVYQDVSGRLLHVIHCKDIHYKSYDSKQWIERDLNLRRDNNNGLYIVAANKFSVAFPYNLQSQKYMGIRRSGNNNVQLEFSYERVAVNGISIPIPNNYKDVLYRDSYINHVITDDGRLAVHTELGESKIISSLKVDYRVTDFEIVLKLHLKGLRVGNDFILKDGKRYYIPIDGKFYFSSDEEYNTLWINQPKMWNDQSSSCDIEHSLYESNGELYYRKVPNSSGTRWLSYSKPSIYIDANTYYSTTADGYVLYTNSAWATCRSAATGSEANSTATSYTQGISGAYVSKNYSICRSFFSFNTSTISIYSWIQAVQLGIRGLGSGYTANSVCCMKGTQATTLTTADFDSFSGSEYAYVSSWSTTGYNVFTFNNQGISDLNRTGTTKICARERAHDYNNSTPTTTDGIDGLYYSENPAENNDPYLLVYEVPAPTILNGTAI